MEDSKKYVHYAGSLLFLVLSFFVLWQMFGPTWFKNIKAEITSQPYARTINVNGEGEVVSKPDIAALNLSVVSESASVKEVTKDGNEKMSSLIKVVKEMGIKDEDIMTTQYYLNPRYSYPERTGRQVFDGYTLTQSLRVKVRDLGIVEDVLDKAVTAGANQIGNISFEIDDDSLLRKQAREEAFKDAREKGEEMATAAGVKLGRVVTFYENGGFEPPMPYYEKAVSLDAGMGGGSAPSIEVGTQEIKLTVSVTYEIE